MRRGGLVTVSPIGEELVDDAAGGGARGCGFPLKAGDEMVAILENGPTIVHIGHY